jgi:hypothetical protein
MSVVATDDFSSLASAIGAPVPHAALVAPSDTDELAKVSRGISFGTAGALAVVTLGGESLTIPSGALAAGVIHPLRVRQVKNTGTTAANIVAYW